MGTGGRGLQDRYQISTAERKRRIKTEASIHHPSHCSFFFCYSLSFDITQCVCFNSSLKTPMHIQLTQTLAALLQFHLFSALMLRYRGASEFM